MRNIYIVVLVLLSNILVSCAGKFEPTVDSIALASAELEFPNDNEICQEGDFLQDGGISIPLQWKLVEGVTGYRIEVVSQTTNEIVEMETLETEITIPLETGTLYVWQVFALFENGESQSERRSFYSRGLPLNSYAPFPAIISIVDNSNGTVDLSWQSTDVDGDIVGYDIYLSQEDPPNLYLENTANTEALNVAVFSGMTYYVVVETKDGLGNSSIAKTNFTAN